MSENIIKEALPEAYADKIDDTQTKEKEIFVPVKFNKQVLNLNLEKAQELAQKGMKFDVISKDYEALKNLAKAEGVSVGEFISAIEAQKNANRQNQILEKCGGDQEFAKHILQLEKGANEEVKGLSELKESFPSVKGIEDLPESVVEAARLKGTLLLDEYLRYLHNQDLAKKQSIKNQREAEESAMGSLLNKNGVENPEAVEFLKGLWQK